MAWVSITTAIDGALAIVLVDGSLAARAPIAELPRRCEVSVHCKLPTAGRLWNPDESGVLDDIEDAILKLADALGRGWAVYALRICTVGVRTLCFYAGPYADLDRLPALIRAQFPTYRFEYGEHHDPGWTIYREHAPSAASH